jgi:hypothetical protein
VKTNSTKKSELNRQNFEALIRLLEPRYERSKSSIGQLLNYDRTEFYFGVKGCAITPPVSSLEELYAILNVKHHAVLVVGRPDGIERELIQDVVYLSTFLLQLCNCNIDFASNKSLFQDFVNEALNAGHSHLTLNGMWLDLVWNPCEHDLEQYLQSRYIGGPLTFTLVYSGHGRPDGLLELQDTSISGKDFLQMFPPPAAYPATVSVWINCCFAQQIMEDMLDNPISEPQDSTNQFGYLQKLKTLYNLLDGRSFNSVSIHHLQWFIIPFCDGVLAAQGGFPTFLDQWQACEFELSDGFRTLSQKFENEDYMLQLMPCANLLATKHDKLELGTLRIFKAYDGDSALLYTLSGKTILIDGGRVRGKETPPFWNTVATLPQIDYVILTHGDQDHVLGLRALCCRKFFGEDSCPKVKNVIVAHFGESTRSWHDQNKLSKEARRIGAKVSQPRTTSKCVQLDKTCKITFILPTAEYFDQATEILKSSRSLSRINKLGTAIAIEDSGNHFLFTGDADGRDIIAALKKCKMTATDWFYADIPHHGSKHNYPRYFLENLTGSVSNLVLSTKKTTHRPAKETIGAINDYLAREKLCQLTFNYQEVRDAWIKRFSKNNRLRVKYFEHEYVDFSYVNEV